MQHIPIPELGPLTLPPAACGSAQPLHAGNTCKAQLWKKGKAFSLSSRGPGGSADVQAAAAGALHWLWAQQFVRGHVTLPKTLMFSDVQFQVCLYTTARVQKMTFRKT